MMLDVMIVVTGEKPGYPYRETSSRVDASGFWLQDTRNYSGRKLREAAY